MLTSGDLVDLDLGTPQGREARYRHPAAVITAQRVLRAEPIAVHIVPLTTTIRGFNVEVTIEPDASNGLKEVSAAQCQHLRSVSTARIIAVRGNVGPTVLTTIREIIAVLLDRPD